MGGALALCSEEEGGASSGRRLQRSARPKRGACLEFGMLLSTLETTKGKIDGVFSQCYLPEEAFVGD